MNLDIQTNSKINGILDILGTLSIVLSIFIFIPLFISLQQQESTRVIVSYIITIIIAGGGGFFLHRLFHSEIYIDLSAGMIICSLGWLLASFIIAIPFMLGFQINFIDAYFEAMSGFTTTGITLLAGLEEMPLSLIFLRSMIQWLGGLGILSFFLMITFRSEGEVWQLFGAEAHKISSSRPVPNLYRTIKILWLIYTGLSFLQILLLTIAGLSVFDAIIHTMTTLSTGGFSRYDASIAYFAESGYSNFQIIEYIFILFMFLGGVNFLLHYKAVKRNWQDIIADVEFRYYLKLVFCFTALIFLSVVISQNFPLDFKNIEDAFRTSLFQVLAIMTTTGYETQYIGSAYFVIFARQLFLVMMVIGGSVGSTGGGIKVIRFVILKRLFGREIKSLALPRRAVKPLTINQTKVDWEDAYRISGLFFAWLMLILLGGLITAIFTPFGIATSISGMFSAVNNIGPSYITVAEMIEIHPVVKVTYTLGMLAGRLEIIPVIALFRPDVWQR